MPSTARAPWGTRAAEQQAVRVTSPSSSVAALASVDMSGGVAELGQEALPAHRMPGSLPNCETIMIGRPRPCSRSAPAGTADRLRRRAAPSSRSGRSRPPGTPAPKPTPPGWWPRRHGAERSGGHQRGRRLWSDGQPLGGPEEGVHVSGADRPQPHDRGQARELGVGHDLGDQVGRDRDPGKQVTTQPAALVSPYPAHRRNADVHHPTLGGASGMEPSCVSSRLADVVPPTMRCGLVESCGGRASAVRDANLGSSARGLAQRQQGRYGGGHRWSNQDAERDPLWVGSSGARSQSRWLRPRSW